MRGISVSPSVLHCWVGELNSTALEFVLTDDLGSVRTAITTQAGAATVAGYMGYGPFGFLQYHAGQTGTNKGYTGQDTDPLSGLDYYVARSYDPLVGLFLSADTVQSNLQGFDPYAYVGNNPETLTDPSGHDFWSGLESGISQLEQAVNDIYTTAEQAWSNWVPDPEAEVAASITTAAIIELVAPIVVPALLVVTLLSIPSDSSLPSASTSSQNQQPEPLKSSTPPSQSSTTPSPAPSTDASGVGARCRNSQCRDLKYSENHGGHTLAQHVNVTPAQVIERAKLSHWYASMFTDFATAQWAVDQVLNSGTLPTKTAKGYWMFANVNVHKSIGIIWRPNGAVWGSTSYVTVLISPLTWTIETAYPSHPSIPIK
jgi:RHS repeat-associated protein